MDSSIVGYRIKELRIKRNMTQTELADALSVAGSTISNWEKGRRLPSISDLKRIAAFFSVSLSVFEVDTRDIDAGQPRSKGLFDHNQIIDFRPVGLRTSKTDTAVLVSGAVLLAVVPFMTEVPSYVFLFTGLLAFGWTVFSIVSRRSAVARTTSKRIQIPMTYKIVYVRKSEPSVVARRLRTLQTGVVMIALSILIYALAFLRFRDVSSLGLDMTLSAYALIAIVTASLRRHAGSRSGITQPKIDYHESLALMNHRAVLVAFITDGVGLLLLSGLHVWLRITPSWSVLSALMMILAASNLVLSYRYHAAFNDTASDLQLCSVDKNNSVTPLF